MTCSKVLLSVIYRECRRALCKFQTASGILRGPSMLQDRLTAGCCSVNASDMCNFWEMKPEPGHIARTYPVSSYSKSMNKMGEKQEVRRTRWEKNEKAEEPDRKWRVTRTLSTIKRARITIQRSIKAMDAHILAIAYLGQWQLVQLPDRLAPFFPCPGTPICFVYCTGSARRRS